MRLICQNDIVASVTSIAFAPSVRISFRGPPPPTSKYRHMFPCVRLRYCHWVNDDDDDSVVVVMVVVVMMAQGLTHSPALHYPV